LELAKLGLKDLPSGDVDMTRQPSVVRADALQKLAEVKASRLRGGGRAITEEELQQAETDIEVAKANRNQAILEARATLASARQRQAVLATTLQRLADTKIIVPTPKGAAASGILGETEYVIGYRRVAEGEFVRIVPLVDVLPLFRLVLDKALRLQVTIPERHKAEVKVGQPVEIEVESHPKQKFAAKVTRISPAVDRSNRTFMVEVVVPNSERVLSAGSFTKTTIVTKADDKAITVPEEAIVNFAGVTKVFVLQGDKVHEVLVKVGAAIPVDDGKRKRTWVEVEGELSVSAKVVTSGMSRLAEGTIARLREP
jgi:RND family efflux transporter MFP subunit